MSEIWDGRIRAWMLEEYINGSLERMKARIIEFKQTRGPRLFSLLLFRFDHFVIYICSKFKRKYTFLADVDIEELYHTAIIALYKAFVSMPDTWEAEKILMRIRSYIRQEFFTWFNNKVALKSDRLEPYDLECLESRSDQELEDRINCFLILDSLPEEDRVLLIKKVMEDRTYESLRQEYGGISKQALSVRVNRILKKIRLLIDKETDCIFTSSENCN